MLKAEGKCPRCGKDVEFWYDMISEDDSVFATLYDWIPSGYTDDKGFQSAGFKIRTEDAKCPNCNTELNVDLKVTPHITADSMYDPRRVVDWDEEQQLKKKAVVNYPRIFRKTHFEIDGMQDADGNQMLLEGYTADEHWNGWACPRFEKAEADRIMAATITAGQEVIFCEETEAYIYKHDEDVEEDELYDAEVIQVNGEDVKIWAIGAWCWVWDEVDEDDLAQRRAWQEELDREKVEENDR